MDDRMSVTFPLDQMYELRVNGEVLASGTFDEIKCVIDRVRVELPSWDVALQPPPK